MQRILVVAHGAVLLSAVGCSQDLLLGTWDVVGIDAVTCVPDRLAGTAGVEEFRDRVTKRYTAAQLVFTRDEPHAFILPVPYEGSVRGAIRGAWMRDAEDEAVVEVYQWISGSTYVPWGCASIRDTTLEVRITVDGDPNLVLYMEKTAPP